MDKMDKLVKEIALKAGDILNDAVCECERDTNSTIAALNAEFALGKYFALMDIVKTYNMGLYVDVAISVTEVQNKLLEISHTIINAT